MLKLLFGFLASGNPRRADGVVTKGATPPEQWNRILFGHEEMPLSQGLYFFEKPPEDISENQIEVTINSDSDLTNPLILIFL